MTVSTEVNQAAYTGNGVTTVFPYTFRILNASNLTVTRIDLQEVETALSLGTDYTVTGAGSYNGGAVNLAKPLPNGFGIIIERDLDVVQETDLRNQGTFFAEVHENVFDYLTMLIQQAFGWIGLALRRPNSRSSFYDAKQYRIAHLADPRSPQDAVNLQTLSSVVIDANGAQVLLALDSDKYTFAIGSQIRDYGVTIPSKLLYGPGYVKLSGVTFGSLIPGVDVANSSVYMMPESYYDLVGDNGDESGKLNLILNVGAKKTGSINRSTFVGSQGPKQIISVDRCETLGNGAMMYTKYAERVTAIGSISCQWFGTNSPAADDHQFWSNAGGYVPGQPGWDYDGLETANPGIGAKIAAFTGFPTQPSDAGRVVGVGRDTFNGTVAGLNLTAAGYRAGAGVYAGNNLAALGTDALRRGVFLTNSVGVGTFAGINVQEGAGNTFAGYNSGAALVRGNRNTWVGGFSGSDFVDANDCIFIGYGSGNDITPENTNPSNLLAIGNDVTGVGAPLITGNMATPKVGVNILPSKISGTFHIRSSDQTASPVAPSGAADELILENGGNAGMTIRSSATGLGVINFSSPTLPSAASVSYNHNTLALTLRANNGDRWAVNSASLNPSSDNVSSVGTASLRPSQIYAANGSISTSDATRKTTPREINSAEISAFAAIMRLPGVWQWLEKFRSEGDEARLHAGPTVQAAIAIMSANGLDWTKYSAFCFDEWEDKYTPIYATRTATRKILKSQVINSVTGEVYSEEYENVEYEQEYDTGEKELVVAAGSLYSFRRDELTWWCMRALADQIDDLTSRISALENR